MNPVVVANVLVGLGWACVAASVVVPFVTKRVHHDVFWLGLVGLFVCGAAALFVLGVNIDQLPPAQGITGLLTPSPTSCSYRCRSLVGVPTERPLRSACWRASLAACSLAGRTTASNRPATHDSTAIVG